MADVRDRLLALARPVLPYAVDVAIGLAVATLIVVMVVLVARPSQFVYIDF